MRSSFLYCYHASPLLYDGAEQFLAFAKIQCFPLDKSGFSFIMNIVHIEVIR